MNEDLYRKMLKLANYKSAQIALRTNQAQITPGSSMARQSKFGLDFWRGTASGGPKAPFSGGEGNAEIPDFRARLRNVLMQVGGQKPIRKTSARKDFGRPNIGFGGIMGPQTKDETDLWINDTAGGEKFPRHDVNNAEVPDVADAIRSVLSQIRGESQTAKTSALDVKALLKADRTAALTMALLGLGIGGTVVYKNRDKLDQIISFLKGRDMHRGDIIGDLS